MNLNIPAVRPLYRAMCRREVYSCTAHWYSCGGPGPAELLLHRGWSCSSWDRFWESQVSSLSQHSPSSVSGLHKLTNIVYVQRHLLYLSDISSKRLTSEYLKNINTEVEWMNEESSSTWHGKMLYTLRTSCENVRMCVPIHLWPRLKWFLVFSFDMFYWG